MQKRLGIHAAGIIGMPSLGAAGAVLGGMTYAERLYTEYVDAVYAMTDIPPLDTTIYARPNAAYDGTLTLGGGTLQDSAGPVAGGLAPLFDGATGYWNIAAIGALWTGAAGVIGNYGIYAKVANVGVWTDGATRMLATAQFDGNNRVQLFKHTANNTLRAYVWFGGTLKIITISGVSTTDWFLFGVSWKDSANGDEAIAYLNAAPSAPVTGLGAWGGGVTIARLGCVSSGLQVWDGWLAYAFVKFGSVLTPTQWTNLYADRLLYGADTNPP